MADEAIMPRLSKYTPAYGQCQQQDTQVQSQQASSSHCRTQRQREDAGWGQGFLRMECGEHRISDNSNGTGDRTRTYDPQIHNLVL
jgi:hypothetical protein